MRTTILRCVVVCLALILASYSFAQSCQQWVNDIEYEAGETIIYEGAGYIANRHVYQNTPPRPEGNEWFWSPTDVCNGVPPQNDWLHPDPDIYFTGGSVGIGTIPSGDYNSVLETDGNVILNGKLLMSPTMAGQGGIYCEYIYAEGEEIPGFIYDSVDLICS